MSPTRRSRLASSARKTNALKADIKLPASAEGFVLEEGRPLLYLSTPSPCQVVVIDTAKNEVAKTYPIKAASGAPDRAR